MFFCFCFCFCNTQAINHEGSSCGSTTKTDREGKSWNQNIVNHHLFVLVMLEFFKVLLVLLKSNKTQGWNLARKTQNCRGFNSKNGHHITMPHLYPHSLQGSVMILLAIDSSGFRIEHQAVITTVHTTTRNRLETQCKSCEIWRLRCYSSSCYYSYQRFWHVNEAYGSFSIVFTHKPRLNAA